jgi:hypothetical protein
MTMRQMPETKQERRVKGWLFRGVMTVKAEVETLYPPVGADSKDKKGA